MAIYSRENKYLIDRSYLLLDGNPLKNTKENSVYIWKILIKIIDNDGKTDGIAANYLQQIMSGRLLHTVDKKLDNETGEKLKALIKLLDKEENREKFLRSYFCAALIILRNGTEVAGSHETWVDYSPKPDSHMQGKGALNTALISYKDDNQTPIGLAMDKYLDTIVRKNADGEYVLTNITATDGDLLLRAVSQTVNYMKDSEKFRTNFQNRGLDDSENG